MQERKEGKWNNPRYGSQVILSQNKYVYCNDEISLLFWFFLEVKIEIGKVHNGWHMKKGGVLWCNLFLLVTFHFFCVLKRNQVLEGIKNNIFLWQLPKNTKKKFLSKCLTKLYWSDSSSSWSIHRKSHYALLWGNRALMICCMPECTNCNLWQVCQDTAFVLPFLLFLPSLLHTSCG